MIWLYNIFLTLSSLFWAPWMWMRARRRKEPVNWKERSGDYPFQLKKGQPRLWLHAVSVGEVMAALPVLRAVRGLDPGLEIVLSVTTSSGHKTATDQAAGLFDHLIYYPIDVYRFVLAGLVRIRPTAFAVMETELWMNFLDAAHNIDVKTLLINGRISDRSFPRSLKLQFFYADLLKRMDRCLMQTEIDADRIKALGGQNVEVFGNCKYDQAAEGLDADPQTWRAALGINPAKPVVVIGSTRSELEEKLIAEAIKGLNAQIVWAPRHLERAEAVRTLCEARGFPVALRSAGGRFAPQSLPSPGTAQPSESGEGVPEVLVLDTYGELSQVYSIADVVVIGGGFDDLGGQNLIQPLAHGKPVIHGPHMQNFKDVTQAALREGASVSVGTSSELAVELRRLLKDGDARKDMSVAARKLVNSNLGASQRYAEAIVSAAYPAASKK